MRSIILKRALKIHPSLPSINIIGALKSICTIQIKRNQKFVSWFNTSHNWAVRVLSLSLFKYHLSYPWSDLHLNHQLFELHTYKKICLCNAWATFSRNLVPSWHINDVDYVVCQLSAEICCQVICKVHHNKTRLLISNILRITERLLNTRDNTQPKQESMSNKVSPSATIIAAYTSSRLAK